MGIKTSEINAVMVARTRKHADAVGSMVDVEAGKQGLKTRPGKKIVEGALARKGKAPSAIKVGLLFALVSTIDVAEKIAQLNTILQDLRQRLPAIIARLPLKLAHFKFQRVEELVQFIGEALLKMKTTAGSAKELLSGIEGWRWQIAGRILFERLVKYDPQLDQFFRKSAGEFVRLVNQEVERSATALVNIGGKPRKVIGKFGRPLKVVQFKLIGADDPTFTDFGYIASNRQGLWAFLPIEIKLPAALRKAPKQLSEFLLRLSSAEWVDALVQEGDAQRTIRIKTADLVFLQHDRAQINPSQIVVAPLNREEFQKALTGRTNQTVTPEDVASVIDVDQGTSATHEVIYYRVRVLVLRDWLESIVRLLTDPP